MSQPCIQGFQNLNFGGSSGFRTSFCSIKHFICQWCRQKKESKSIFLKFICQAIYFKACIVENNTFNNARTDFRDLLYKTASTYIIDAICCRHLRIVTWNTKLVPSQSRFDQNHYVAILNTFLHNLLLIEIRSL